MAGYISYLCTFQYENMVLYMLKEPTLIKYMEDIISVRGIGFGSDTSLEIRGCVKYLIFNNFLMS
jgi:hypothetical protein